MAANVGTPRFYVNILEYLGAIGYTEINDRYRTNPTSMKSSGQTITTSVPEGIFPEKSFVAYLGHTGGSLSWESEGLSSAFTEIVNGATGASANALDPDHTGFSIASFNGLDVGTEITTYNHNEIGSIVVGAYYDMPHSPDLNLKLSYEYDGVKNIQTKGGSTLSNASYTKPAKWGSMGAWQLGTDAVPNPTNFRSGRRVWDLSFSYLSDTDVMPVLGVQNYAGDDTTDILNGTDFFSVVWNKTMSGHLPFIFQPDRDNPNADQFAICRFDMKSLTYDQVANNVYNVKLKIRECW
tara:strand:- start:1522 stop:2406 length:885 start_codon:yes stop_codon:yes gene_type:complete